MPNQLLGDVLALAGGIAWGFTTLVVKSTSLARAAPEKTLQYQLVISAPMLAVAAWLFGETDHPRCPAPSRWRRSSTRPSGWFR